MTLVLFDSFLAILKNIPIFHASDLESAISPRSSVSLSEESYFESKIWVLGRLIATGLVIVSTYFPRTELGHK